MILGGFIDGAGGRPESSSFSVTECRTGAKLLRLMVSAETKVVGGTHGNLFRNIVWPHTRVNEFFVLKNRTDHP